MGTLMQLSWRLPKGAWETQWEHGNMGSDEATWEHNLGIKTTDSGQTGFRVALLLSVADSIGRCRLVVVAALACC